jgi:hypothetical protein
MDLPVEVRVLCTAVQYDFTGLRIESKGEMDCMGVGMGVVVGMILDGSRLEHGLQKDGNTLEVIRVARFRHTWYGIWIVDGVFTCVTHRRGRAVDR